MNRFYDVIFFFLLLSCALPILSYASPVSFSRRHLSQAPSTDPSTNTPNGSPFFPLYSSTSPPPPSPPLLPPPSTTLATFPANISALVLPRSPKPHTTSQTLLIPAISAVLAVATVIGLALFLYGRWKGQIRNFKEDVKSSDSQQTPLPRNTNEHKLSVAASTSDVLYIGNVVTSSGSSFIKPESPEIRPLPPLPARSFLESNQITNEEEEEEEEQNDDESDFYSPLTSLANQESREEEQRNNPYSNSSCSHSPVMSPSGTISPTMTSNARNWSIKNPKSPSPERKLRSNKRNGSSLRMFSLWNQNLGFPRISSASTSPERGVIRTPDAYARSSMYSSVSTTPDRFFRKVLDNSPPRWNDFSRNVKSLFLSSSPARDYCIDVSESSRTLRTSWENQEVNESVMTAPPQRPPPAMPEPPPLVPPSQSFMIQKSGKKLSFSELPNTKLKPLPWDKALLRPRSCRKNTWDNLKFNSKQRSLSCDLPMLNQENRVLDSRKSQNIAFLLTSLELNTNDVLQALLNGHYEALRVEVLESLSRIALSDEEEKKLKSYSDDSLIKLAPSEKFLKELLNVPFVFKRVDALLSMATFKSNVELLQQSFGLIQAACEELSNNKMLMKLLEAHDFNLETLGTTTMLHSVVQKIIESKGIKELEALRDLNSVLVNVKKSAELDYDVLRSDMSRLYQEVKVISEVLLLSEENEGIEEQQWWKFRESMTRFLEMAVEEIKKIETEESSLVSAVKEITECFHGDLVKEEDQLLRVFVIIRDFLSIIDKICKKIDAN